MTQKPILRGCRGRPTMSEAAGAVCSGENATSLSASALTANGCGLGQSQRSLSSSGAASGPLVTVTWSLSSFVSGSS